MEPTVAPQKFQAAMRRQRLEPVWSKTRSLMTRSPSGIRDQQISLSDALFQIGSDKGSITFTHRNKFIDALCHFSSQLHPCNRSTFFGEVRGGDLRWSEANVS
jgi:hypothetical protein